MKNKSTGITLSNVELEIIKHICNERTSQETAFLMILSVRTIENNRYRIYKKLGVRNMAGLIKYAHENNLVE